MSKGKGWMPTLSLPKKDEAPPRELDPEPMGDAAAIQTRKEVVLALLPVASRHSLLEPHAIVEIATHLCEYINTGRKQDTPA